MQRTILPSTIRNEPHPAVHCQIFLSVWQVHVVCATGPLSEGEAALLALHASSLCRDPTVASRSPCCGEEQTLLKPVVRLQPHAAAVQGHVTARPCR